MAGVASSHSLSVASTSCTVRSGLAGSALAATGAYRTSAAASQSCSATAPVGPGLIRVQASHYTQDNSSNGANKVSLGYVHNLSKRTALYADVARLNNKGASTYQVGGVNGLSNNGPVAGGNSTGLAVGMKHTF